MSNTLVFVACGQSNMVGNKPVTNTYAGISDCWMIGEDGFARPFSEPAFDATNEATGPIQHGNPDVPGQSSMGAFFTRLRELGETRTLVCVPSAVGSTSALNWQQQIADSPPTYQVLYGAMMHQISEAMRFPNPVLGGFILNQGEQDAQTSLIVANAWGTTWGSTFDTFLTQATANGWTWAKTTRFWIDILQAGSSLTWAPNVRAAQLALDVARADTHSVQEPDASPADLHLWAADQIALGILRANDWFAAT